MAQDYPEGSSVAPLGAYKSERVEEATRLADTIRKTSEVAEAILKSADHIASMLSNAPQIHGETGSASHANEVAPRSLPPMTLVDEHIAAVLSIEVRLAYAMESMRHIDGEVARLLPRK
jgi:hypothetical protein